MNELIIDTRIYKKAYVMIAINAYSGITKIESQFDIEKNKGILQFKCPDDKYELFRDEFCNYLIAVIATAV
ncbi:hypothetical protein E4V42_07710 [Clostridium estertheticum]|uniref:Uncharacterized protein n=1 Tax=Clostridium estertheticum TaxID=238834 RepID=A0A5N7IM09_9CLOT|nr:hypothetical protein [Clostridium estertheticum]MPQ31321.1 hypothetical protein [Clostridium estertheticum]MPQ61995.1 hypothetical protein [Clostridium estertheticum]